ncbi:hypothetical protein RUM44_003106 [Polyplax serrata]|uniref:Uncharacterized protein n=1 Tax=Polyplax serrata TaxID=468196 RepID=A0ABR1AY12_POLSC
MEVSSKISINELAAEGSIRSFTEPGEGETDDSRSKSFQRWSSRMKNLMAYAVLIMCFVSVQRSCFSLGIYGSTIFIPYIIFKVFLVMPVVVVEIMLGRYVTGYFIRVYTFCPMGLGLLVCHFIMTFLFIILSFANSIYLLKYLISLFSGVMTWKYCKPSWAKINCYELGDQNSAYQTCVRVHSEEFCKNLTWETSGHQFWKSLGEVKILYLQILLSFFILPAIFSLLLTLVSFLSPGSVTGFMEIWKMDFDLLLKPQIWVTGFEYAVVTQCIGLFPLYFVSSHGLFEDDIFIDALIVLFSDVIFCLVIALPILSIIKTVNSKNPPFEDLTDVYVWISEALTVYPPPNTFWAFIFYLEMTILELGSQMIYCLSIFEATYCIFKERIHLIYIALAFVVIVIPFTAPLILLPTLATFPIEVAIILNVFINLLELELFYGLRKFYDDFHFMMGYHPPFFFTLMLITAAALSLIFVLMKLIFGSTFSYETSIQNGEYISAGIPASVFIIVMAMRLYLGYRNKDVMQIFSYNKEWGPSLPLLKKSRIVFDSKTVTKEFMYRQELSKKPQMKPNDFKDQNIVHLI